MITYFKSISDTSSPFYRDINVALDRIRSGKSKDIVDLVRSETNKDMRNEKKKLLPAICFSGTFSKRADNSIVDHSGFICLDFDGFDGNIEDKRLELINDKYVYSVFTSPSGDGLKVYLLRDTLIQNLFILCNPNFELNFLVSLFCILLGVTIHTS